MPSRSELVKAERILRQYDKALRVRISVEAPDLVTVERKTFRGRIGATSPQKEVQFTPDSGRRREEGHLVVCYLPRSSFNVRDLRESLMAADTWKKPGWIDEVERKDRVAHAHRKQARTDFIRYKAVEVWDRYTWKSKSRISMR